MTQSDIRDFLATVLNVDDEIIVPKQGNWYNPQDSIISPNTPSTWVAFLMTNGNPRVIQYYMQGEDSVPASVVQYTSKIDLQIVGQQAEELVQSIGHWLKRSDVMEEMESLNGQLMAQDLGKYIVSNFDQDGLNTILAYNTTFYIQWASVLQSDQIRTDSTELGGTINVE